MELKVSILVYVKDIQSSSNMSEDIDNASFMSEEETILLDNILQIFIDKWWA